MRPLIRTPEAHLAPGVEPVSSTGTDLVDFGAVASAIWRNLPVLIATTLSAIVVAYIYAFHIATPMYRSVATVVYTGQNQDVVSLPGEGAKLEFTSTLFNTEAAILLNRSALLQVIERMNLAEDPEFNPFAGSNFGDLSEDELSIAQQRAEIETLRALREAIQISNIHDTYVIQIFAETKRPQKSRQIANAVANVYLENQTLQKQQVNREAADWMTARLEELQLELIEAEARIDGFEYGEDGAARSADAVRLERLSAEAQSIRELYKLFVTQLKEISVRESRIQPDGRILSYADLPHEPSSPRKLVILFFSAVLGGLAGLGFIFLRETTSDPLKTPRDLEHITGCRLIGATPRASRFRRKSGRAGFIHPDTPLYGPAMEDIRANLTVMPEGITPPQIIAVTSAMAKEGKTTLSMSLAASFAGSDRRVLLVDADLRQRRLSKNVSPDAQRGLVSLCTQDEKTLPVVRDPYLGVDVLCCETQPEKPLDLISSEVFAQVIEGTRTYYDIIIVDTPPVLTAPELKILGKLSDAIIFVARYHVTPAQKVIEALETLARISLQPLGVVMTAARRSMLKY